MRNGLSHETRDGGEARAPRETVTHPESLPFCSMKRNRVGVVGGEYSPALAVQG